MHRYPAELTLATAVFLAGCASAPSDTGSTGPAVSADEPAMTAQTTESGTDGYLDGASPDQVIKCRKVETIGSRLSKTVCGPMRDDSALLGVIDQGGTREPH